jgi:hypothetical protein
MIKKAFVAVPAMLGLALLTGASDGRTDTLPAMAGHAWVAADAGCFASGWSQVRNTCGTSKKLLIPVQSRANGSVNFRATPTTNNPPGTICINPVQCRAVVTTQSNAFVSQTALTTICSAAVPVSLGTLTVASSSVAHYDCDFPGGSAPLGSVTF